MSQKKVIALAAALLVSVRVSFAESRHWKLTTADTQAVIEVRNNAPIITRLENVAEGHNWADGGLRIPLMAKVAVGGQERPMTWVFVHGEEDRAHGTLTLLFTNAEPKVALKSIWRARSGRGPIEHWVEIENRTAQPLTVSQQESLALPGLDPEGSARLWWIKRGGSNASVQGGTFQEPIVTGHELVLHSNCEDGSSPVPWLAVQVGDQRGIYLGWEFSGRGRIQAKAAGNAKSLDIRVGNEPDFKTDIGPHEVFWVPPAFVGCYTGDIDEGSYSLHRFILEKLRPKMPANYPDPTLAYNLYLDAGGNKATETDVLRCAHTCHDLGFETFMPDAMWFPETGDWRWDPARFPHGIGPIEQYVHSSGMKMALWCAWTNGGISPRADALSVHGPHGHPDWFRSNVPPNWTPGPFYGVQLCLGCDEAKQWATEKTQWLVKHHHLDYLKHDMGLIVTSCDQKTHRHQYGQDVSYWAALGYYAVQEQLRRACPDVVLENCSGGGHIKDFGVIQRTHYTVATDTLSNLPDRQSIYDSTFAFPPLLLQAYTYDNFYHVKGDEPGPFLWRSGMMSAWQIDPTDTATWTKTQRDSAKRATAVYKEWIRPMLQDVKVHHILPRPDGTHWDGMFYMSEATGHGMLYIFRPDSPDNQQTIHLAGLEADRRYWVWSEEGLLRPLEKSGAELMNDGLQIGLTRRYSSDLVYVQDASQGAPPGLRQPAR
jgi:alpha-galactosidase